ncbi:hypothetical protein DER44DRAFT_742831 [Fusarium oxysporum]|nr:hypothetical protein DER44DRAFT_742831 [Fusarium oxysporum]
MFRPKEPFEGQETIDARLIETSDEGLTVLSSQCISFARTRPDDFMNYLRHAWEQDGSTIRENEDLLDMIQTIKITRPDGKLIQLMGFYLPPPKLVLRNRHLLPNEDFKFLSLEPGLSSSTD